MIDSSVFEKMIEDVDAAKPEDRAGKAAVITAKMVLQLYKQVEAETPDPVSPAHN